MNSPGEVGSGKSGTPCERMHRANPTASRWNCCIWAWVGGSPELGERGEFEPQAAISVVAATAAAATEIFEVVLNMNKWYPATGHTRATHQT